MSKTNDKLLARARELGRASRDAYEFCVGLWPIAGPWLTSDTDEPWSVATERHAWGTDGYTEVFNPVGDWWRLAQEAAAGSGLHEYDLDGYYEELLAGWREEFWKPAEEQCVGRDAQPTADETEDKLTVVVMDEHGNTEHSVGPKELHELLDQLF